MPLLPNSDTDDAIVFPASFGQERLWFLDRLHPNSAAYNMPVPIPLPGRISRAVLECCFAELVRRHETLRTTFASKAGQVLQVVSPPFSLPITLVDLRRYPAREREARFNDLATAECQRTFDLTQGPLIRSTLFRLAPENHILLVVMHHIISDAWSVDNLTREFGELYAAFDAGRTSPLEPLPIQYVDWACWQRKRLTDCVLVGEVAAWQKLLEGAPTVLDLPLDRARPSRASYAGDLELFCVEAELAEQLRQLGRRYGCTLYMVLLAAFGTMLGRYAGQSDLLIGSPLTNRNGSQIEPLIGLFVNTVVLRIDLRGAPTVIELLDRVRKMMLEVHAHGEIPLESLISAIQPVRGFGHHPLFQALFSLQESASRTRVQRPTSPRRGTTLSNGPNTGTSKFDLSLFITDTVDGLEAAWEYSSDLFDRQRVRRMSAHFTGLLSKFVEEPDSLVGDLPMMDSEEEGGIIAIEAVTRRRTGEVSRSLERHCIHEIIAEQALLTPDAIAVEAGKEVLTYAQLALRAADLAKRLRSRGLGTEACVGLCIGRNANLVVGVLAILQSGCAYVPLDPSYPERRLAYIAGDSNLDFVVTEVACAQVLPDGVKPLYIDRDDDGCPNTMSAVPVLPGNLAYILYTSGTTGTPKGVAVCHESVTTMLRWAAATFDRRSTARVLASTSICFDLSVFEIFLPLIEGGTVVVVENILAVGSPTAPEVTLINTVPSAMRELLRTWRPGASLRTLNLAGEALSRDLVQRLFENLPGVTVYNLYGPTETTVYSTGIRLDRSDQSEISIGRPISGTRVYVLDDCMRRVPIGVHGEVYIGGEGLARGYLRRPGRTAERYLPDPFSREAGSRMYRTGDMACWRADGTLDYRGRADKQVKLRGHRIELGEIESAVRQHPLVRDAIVLLRKTASGDARLLAYLTTSFPPPGQEEVDAVVRRTLPGYMVPSRFVFLDKLPTTTSGKIDRAALAELEPESQTPGRSAATESEAVLCRLFGEALGVSNFDPDGDFFASGGHSLLATGVVARATEVLGVDMPLNAIFEYPTPARLSAFATTVGSATLRLPLYRERKAGEDESLPLSFAQEGMWFYDRVRPGTALYNLPVILRAQGSVDREVLQRTIDYITARHDALRMEFGTLNGEPIQRVATGVRVKVAIYDLSDLASDERRRRSQFIIERESRKPFDLRRAPLIRVSLVVISPSEQYLVFVMHHIIADGWSTDIFLRELKACYEAFSKGRDPELPALPMQYSDYVLWQRSTMDPTFLEGRMSYFRNHFAGAPTLISLPTDHPRPDQPSFRGSIISFDIDAEAGAKLLATAEAGGATPHMAYLAVFVALLHQYSGQRDIVIGIPAANRNRAQWRDLIGLFTNTLPVRIACGDAPNFWTLLERVREASVNAYKQEDVPFDRVVQELSPTRELGHHPIFQVMFGFQELRAEGGGSFGEVLATTGTSKFDLSLNLSRSGKRAFGVVEYATDLFNRTSIERVANRYRTMVEALASKPDQSFDTVIPLDENAHAWREQGKMRALPPHNAEVTDETVEDKSTECSVEARTGLMQQIATIWSEVLGHSRFSVNQNFFEVGGHSLAAMRVMARIEDLRSIEVPFACIFTTPTIAGLAQIVESTSRHADAAIDGSATGLPELQREQRTGRVPLSFAQERLWFLDQLAPGLPIYNITFPVVLEGEVDVPALERSIECTGNRHECLRARFIAGQEGPEQTFDPVMLVDLRLTDLAHIHPAARTAEGERLMGIESRHYFDLSKGPLLHAHLLCMEARQSVLLLTIHHIVADAVSVDILIRDLLAFYTAERTGVPEELPELPVQYADFAIWQRGWLRGERLAMELEYWRKQLAGVPPLLALPTDKPRPSLQTYAGEQVPIALGSEQSAAVRRLAREEQSTPFMVLLCIFGVTLGRLSATTDVIVGTPVIGRPRRELEELVGVFLNTLPMRIQLDRHASFRELLRRTRDIVVEAFSHQDLPFEAIVHELLPERTLAHNPVFQVMFAFQRPSAHRPQGATQKLVTPILPQKGRRQTARSGSGTAKFDLTLFLVDDDEDQFQGAIEYRTDLFDATTIERFASNLSSVLAKATAGPDNPISDLLLAGSADRASIAKWNATATRSDQQDFLASSLCSSQSRRTSSAPAVSSKTEVWSYAELMGRAGRLAKRLQDLGVGSDCRVAIWAEPSAHLVAATLGVWIAGGACVPLDPSYPATRLAFMARDCGAKCLIATRPDAAATLDVDIVTVVQDVSEVHGSTSFSCDLSDSNGGTPDQLAYVVYTSGSTGQPKGVAITHRGLVNLVLWQRSRDASARRTLQFASPSFDVFFQELLLCLATGGELVMAGPEVRRDPELLIDLCRERRIERMFLPYVALREVAEAAANRESLPCLREVITAGEQLQVTRAIRRWFSANSACRLFNQYGPSETHVVTEEHMPSDPSGWSALPPIGMPIANATVYVLDATLQPVPVETAGDLYVGGICLARGYIDRAAPTAERFLPDPFCETPGARMYRTGDRSRWLSDGRIEFLGRSDDQVKIRGYRVELGEVETALAKLPLVRQAVVVALPDGGGNNRLAGYVLSDDPAADPERLRAELSRTLPAPLVPATLTLMDRFPRTPSGKIDRRALSTPPSRVGPKSLPSTEIERMVAQIWRDVLCVETVGLDENFFALGGHSLSATQVCTRLRERLATEVPVRWMFEHSTIESLAAEITRNLQERGPAINTAMREIQPIVRHGSEIPASFAQQRLWFLDRLVPGSPAYNLSTSFAFPASLNVDVLRRSLDELVRRHEALRTIFRETDGHAVQVVTGVKRVSLEVLDLSYLPANELDAEVRFQIDEDGRRSFDLSAGPLFRATLLGLGHRGYLLLLSMHHIISDAWSLRILHHDLEKIFEAVERGAPMPLPPLRLQYGDFASWQRNELKGTVLEDLISHWRTHLLGAPQWLELPTDRPRTGTSSFRGATCTFELNVEDVRGIQSLSRTEGASLFMTMLAVYMELLRRYTGQEDMLIGAPIGTRQRPELEDIVGLFVNTLVLRGNLAGDPTFRELLQRVREEALGAYRTSDLPFEHLVEQLQPRRDWGLNPLVQVAFGLHHAPANQAGGIGLSGGAGVGEQQAPSGNGTSKFDLSLVLSEAEGHISAVFEYNRDLFEPQTLVRMASHFSALVRQAVLTPDVPLSKWSLCTPSEAEDVLKGWSRGSEIPANVGLVELLALHAQRNPTSVAVDGPDGQLNYAELDLRAARLARFLRALGVSTEVSVGLCLGNSVHLPVSMIAILSAGGVYVPLDPALPLARLLYLIADARVKVLITDRLGAERFTGCDVRIVCTDGLEDSSTGDVDAPVVVDPDQLAYIVYTSGSTGQPKGVMATHRGLQALIAAQQDALGLGPTDRILKFATPSFDASVFEISLALAAGATLCLEEQGNLLPGPELIALIRRRKITMVTLPPSSLGVLPVEECPTLRLLFVAGEACTAELVRRWAPGRRMVNGYGPTEASVWTTFANCQPNGMRPSIGTPVANARVVILDRHLGPVPVGVPGELYVGGPAVARGYLGRPGPTAASFIPDPWGPVDARMYRTGDVARWQTDGSIDFLGRVDGQIKLRGVRIEPSEIEATIADLSGVAHCVVMLREDQPENPILVAYVVPGPKAALDAVEIRSALLAKLPRFLVPSRIMILNNLPRTASGKLDRHSLPAPPRACGEEVPSRPNSIEDAVCKICSDLLDGPVERDDNFFDRGGHSLLLTRVLSRIREDLGIDVPIRRMFEAATVAEFCQGLEVSSRGLSFEIPRLPRNAALKGDDRDNTSDSHVIPAELPRFNNFPGLSK